MVNSYFDDMIESKLLSTHTAYLARITSISGNNATVQPLTLQKQYGKPATKQAAVPNVPILRNARYKISIGADGNAVASAIGIGDIALCVVCERDITAAKNGVSTLPAIRRHDMSDSVIVGVL